MMFEPQFKAESEMLNVYLEEIDRQRYAFDTLILPRRYQDWFQRRAWVRTVHHSTRIEGNTLSEEEVGDLLEAPPSTVRNIDVQEVVNYAKALRFVDELSDHPEVPVDERVVRHLNKLILDGTVAPVLTPGEYRKGDNYVTHPITGEKIYVPPSSGDVPSLMRDFAAWVQSAGGEEHPVIQAGIVHLEFVAIHPFWDGNGRTARTLSTLALQRRGYAFNKLISLDRHFDLNRLAYFDEISRVVGRNYRKDKDATSWLEYFARIFALAAKMQSDWILDFRRSLDALEERLSPAGVKHRQIEGIAYTMVKGSIRRKDYVKITGVSAPTATKDLQSLEELGVLRGESYGRGRRYIFVR